MGRKRTPEEEARRELIRDLLCRIFAAKVFDLMGWNSQYRYKILGKPAVYKDEKYHIYLYCF